MSESVEVRKGKQIYDWSELGGGGLQIESYLMRRIPRGLVVKIPENGDLANTVGSHG